MEAMDAMLEAPVRTVRIDVEAAEPACPHCTDTPPPGRLSLGGLARLVGRHLRLERGLLHTLVDFSLRPGRALSGYFGGASRRRYVNPVNYLLLSAATSMLVFELYQDRYRAWMAASIAQQTRHDLPENIRALGPAAEFSKAYLEVLMEVMQRSTFTSLALLLPFALLTWLLLRGPRLNLAEALAFSLYAMGTGLFLHSLFVAPLLMLGFWDLAQYGGFALYALVPVWMGLRYFGTSVSVGLRVALATLGGYAAGVAIIYVVVGIFIAMRMLGH